METFGLLEIRRELDLNNPKSFYSFEELAKIYPGKDSSLRRALSRWVKERYIHKLGNGFYCFSPKALNLAALASVYYGKAYVSLEWALAYHGAISCTESITVNYAGRARQTEILNYKFDFEHISKKYIKDFNSINGANIAGPEKALLDLLYLANKNKRGTDSIAELNKSVFDTDKLRELGSNYPRQVTDRALALLN